MRRVLLAGVLAGLAMYVWMSVAHIVLPLGQMGVQEIPNEAALLGQMRATLGDSHGLYLYPGMGVDKDMKKYQAKLTTTPSGLLVYNPPGSGGMTPGRLIGEFLTELAEALLLTWMMAQTRLKSYGSRLAFALAAGVVAGIATNFSYWIWYGFPALYTLAYAGVQIVGFLAAGLVAARMLPRDA